MDEKRHEETFPVIPVKGSVLYPGVMLPIIVGVPSSLIAAETAFGSPEKSLIIVTQKDAASDEPGREGLYAVGTRAEIQSFHRVGSAVHLVLRGLERVDLEIAEMKPFLRARAEPRPVRADDPDEVEALQRELARRMLAVQGLAHVAQPDLAAMLSQLKDPFAQVYLLASVLDLEVAKAQAILEADSPLQALKLMHSHLIHETNILRMRRRISRKAASEMTKEQREYFLRRELHAIQAELGEEKGEEAEDLHRRLAEAKLPAEVRAEAERELGRLSRQTPLSPEYQVMRSHLELVLELPWAVPTTDNLDLARARRILDEDHYNLEEVKQRILEQLAVLKLNPKARAPILCFVGPPGVGKTSLGQSIARGLGRRFERMSLGGMHDEAELRGHRRTYVGAMPGRIIQAIRRAGASNPLLMLDEIDKLGRDFRGDPAAALMEVLDPAQNSTFRDNYLDLPFDLSSVFFITTANSTDGIPSPLLDRMELLRLAGYAEEEKVEIARRYLLPRQRTQAGLSENRFEIDPDALLGVIRHYTREAGVRQLERALGSLARKAAMDFAQGRSEPYLVRERELAGLLGPETAFFESVRRELKPGVAAGLAWTEAGGDVLYIEAVLLPGRRELVMTGSLGDVMKESVRTALGFVWSRLDALAPGHRSHRDSSVHVHVPAGAVPKDGPSAGLAIAVAAASLYTGSPARGDTAMTGEVTLTGLVLPVGGVKEKLLAARRAELKRVLLPKANEKDLAALPKNLRAGLEIVLVDSVEEALAAAIPDLGARLAGMGRA